MSDSIVHLDAGHPVDPKRFLSGAWREIGVRRVPQGDVERLVADGVEYAVYVMGGEGRAEIGGGRTEVAAGTAMTVLRGDEVTFASESDPLELFVVALDA